MVACNGLGGFIAAIAYRYIIGHLGVAYAFLIMGCVYLCLLVAGGLYVAPPPEDWAEQLKDREAKLLAAEEANKGVNGATDTNCDNKSASGVSSKSSSGSSRTRKKRNIGMSYTNRHDVATST